MDEKRINNEPGQETFEELPDETYEDGCYEETSELSAEYPPEEYDKTQEMESVSERQITPRAEFTEQNAADDLEKTLLIDSVTPEYESEEFYPPQTTDRRAEYPPAQRRRSQNTVKRRKKPAFSEKPPKPKTNHTRTMRQVFIGVVLSTVSIVAGVMLSFLCTDALKDFTGMDKGLVPRFAEITIDASRGSDAIVDELYRRGIIEMPSLMKTYIKFTQDENKPFLSGTYRLYSNMSYASIIDILKTKKTYTQTVKVTITEGMTAKEIGELLEQKHVCRAVDFENCYKNKLNKFDFEEQIEVSELRYNALEGYLFPDTYEFFVVDDLEKNPNFDTSANALEAINKMLRNFETKFTKDLKRRMNELGLSLDETIILASLICREGTNAENMSFVSSVFHNRLNGVGDLPKLQSDTTYTYIERVLDPATTAANRDRMQKIKDAYDTYKCDGLPAGAICNPGLDAIKAALYPAESNYLYFLASKDGHFYYAQTQEQHEQNIKDAALRDETA